MEDLEKFKKAIHARDSDLLIDSLGSVKHQDEVSSLLISILLEEWHEAHEDIVFELGLIGDPSATDSIGKAATIPFKYMIEWDNLHEFQRKCAYALARIGTEESRLVLEELCKNQDSYISEYGQEGLKKWPLKK